MRKPTNRDLLAECRRLTAENERLTRLVATQRPELEALRAIEVRLRDLVFHLKSVPKLHDAVRALLPGNDDLPGLTEMLGLLGNGKERVDAVLASEK